VEDTLVVTANKKEQGEMKQNMQTKHSGLVEAAKDGVVAAVKGTGDIVQATVDTIVKMLGTTIQDTGQVGQSMTDAIADVASGAIRGAAVPNR
jgi:hypothetical protein